MSETIDTEPCIRALEMAVQARRPAAGLVHHSDRGSQYASHDYRAALSKYGMVYSMKPPRQLLGQRGREGFWETLKSELADEMDFDSRSEGD